MNINNIDINDKEKLIKNSILLFIINNKYLDNNSDTYYKCVSNYIRRIGKETEKKIKFILLSENDKNHKKINLCRYIKNNILFSNKDLDIDKDIIKKYNLTPYKNQSIKKIPINVYILIELIISNIYDNQYIVVNDFFNLLNKDTIKSIYQYIIEEINLNKTLIILSNKYNLSIPIKHMYLLEDNRVLFSGKSYRFKQLLISDNIIIRTPYRKLLYSLLPQKIQRESIEDEQYLIIPNKDININQIGAIAYKNGINLYELYVEYPVFNREQYKE